MKMKLNQILFTATALLLFSCAKEKELEQHDDRLIPELQKISSTIQLTEADGSATKYLYVPTTGSAPRKVVALAPFYQGEEKIVQLKLGKKGIEAFELDPDTRFQSQRNNSPVITINGEYKAYQCILDDLGECTQKEEPVPNTTENNATHFLPAKTNTITQHEVNYNNLFLGDSECFKQTGDEVVTHYEMSKGVINFEIEKTLTVSPSNKCLNRHYVDSLSNFSFKTKQFFSLVRLDSIADKNYKAFNYPVEEHGQFGFFKKEYNFRNNDFDGSRPEQFHLLNRWSPNRSKITYYLSDSFEKEENKLLKKATIDAIGDMNKQMITAGIPFTIELKEGKGRKAGDLRNSMIVLIDDPLENGLLGYGPSVADPRTGEIVKAHTNMYSGVLRQVVRRVWNGMVQLTKDVKKATPITPANDTDTDADTNSTKPVVADDNEAAKNKALSKLDLAQMAKHSHHHHGHSHLDHGAVHNIQKKIELRDRLGSRAGEGNNLTDRLFRALKKDEDRLNAKDRELIDAHERKVKLLDFYAENNMYSQEFFQIATSVKALLPGIKDIKGVYKNDGTLKEWDDISKKQKDEARDLILPYIYKATFVHEIGHNLGLRHNFEGSLDKDNFYTQKEADKLGLKNIPAYSSIMDYAVSELNELRVLGKYDLAALNFAYNKRVMVDTKEIYQTDVTLSTGQVTQVEEEKIVKQEYVNFDTLSDLRRTLQLQSRDIDPDGRVKITKSIRKFEFCTDENVGTSNTCNRFDEGTTVTEIIKGKIDRYNNSHKYRNFRNGRERFSRDDTLSYLYSKFRQFYEIRIAFEEWEAYYDFLPQRFKYMVVSGCTEDDKLMYGDFCDTMSDRLEATKLAGDFLLNVLKTPEHTCVLMDANERPELKKLSEIYDDVRYSNPGYEPKSCFDDVIRAELATNPSGPQFPVAENGKFTNDTRGNSKFEKNTSDISIRGNYIDKIVAAMVLTDRTAGGTVDKTHMNFLDHPYMAGKVQNFIRHITIGDELIEPVPFKLADGTEVSIPYSLNLDEYKVEALPYWQTGLNWFLGLNSSFGAETYLNESLLWQLYYNSYTNSPDFKDDAVDSMNYFSVIAYKDTDVINDKFTDKKVRVGDYVYASTDANIIAKEIIDTIVSDAQFLKELGMDTVKAIFEARSNPTMPDGLSEAEQKAFKVEDELLDTISNMAGAGAALPADADLIAAGFTPEMVEGIKAAYSLGVEGIAKIKELKVVKAPADADENTKKAYEAELATLDQFIKGQDSETVTKLKKVLTILPNHLSTK